MTRDDQPSQAPLSDFVPRPAPPGLRRKVLAAAAGVPPSDRFLSLSQWAAAAACVSLIFAALAGNAILARKQTGRLDVLLADQPTAVFPPDAADQAELEQAVGAEAARLARLQSVRPRPVWASGETPRPGANSADFMEEDADVHAKNPR
ncbi:MAG: hypothetical protein NTZ26_06610 [Candidatus Aminicenantes bacterium]|nr:hypothetical protein [Candidatus Aminicenantes bacterium]